MIRNTATSPIRDTALIVAGNQVEHYEVAAYGSLRTFAGLLDKTLEEEKKAHAKLTEVGENYVNEEAAQSLSAVGASA